MITDLESACDGVFPDFFISTFTAMYWVALKSLWPFFGVFLAIAAKLLIFFNFFFHFRSFQMNNSLVGEF